MVEREKITMGFTSLDIHLAKTIYEAREEEIQRYLLERRVLQARPAHPLRQQWGALWSAWRGKLADWFKPTAILTEANGLGHSRRP
jgi:hypothetical protein